MWRPQTLLEAIESGEAIDFPTDRHGRPRCPNCGVTRPAAVIVDVRDLPIPEEWACDCCWTHWMRTGRVVDGKEPIAAMLEKPSAAIRQREWKRRWAVAHAAPAHVVSKFTEQP